jgi:hypothetical protein
LDICLQLLYHWVHNGQSDRDTEFYASPR